MRFDKDDTIDVGTMEIKSHLKNEDSILVNLPNATGYFRVERYNGANLIDSIELYADDPKGKTFRWHVPKSLFKNVKNYTVRLTLLPMPTPTPIDGVNN